MFFLHNVIINVTFCAADHPLSTTWIFVYVYFSAWLFRTSDSRCGVWCCRWSSCLLCGSFWGLHIYMGVTWSMNLVWAKGISYWFLQAVVHVNIYNQPIIIICSLRSPSVLHEELSTAISPRRSLDSFLAWIWFFFHSTHLIVRRIEQCIRPLGILFMVLFNTSFYLRLYLKISCHSHNGVRCWKYRIPYLVSRLNTCYTI